jgi:hypothetical protein
MRPLREVALLALIYRHCYRNRWDSIDDIATDQEIAPGELGWLSMFAACLPEQDWQLLAALDDPETFEPLARQLDPLRAEAVLHAALPNGVYPAGRWSAPYRERWGEIRSRMRLFEQQGYTASWRAATGDTFEQYADAWH